MTNPQKIAVYYRVSTDKQDLASQKQAVEQWLAGLENKPETEVVEDHGISGSTTNRPGYQQLLAMAAAGEIDTIVCYKLDRFSRSATNAIRTLLELDEKGVGFISVTQPALNLGHANPFRRTMLSAFAEISQIERETISERTKAGLEVARARGKTLGRPSVKVTSAKHKKIIKLRKQGLTLSDIANKVNLSRTKVHTILSDYCEEQKRA